MIFFRYPAFHGAICAVIYLRERFSKLLSKFFRFFWGPEPARPDEVSENYFDIIAEFIFSLIFPGYNGLVSIIGRPW
jgi:hypothetical protein